MSLTHPVSSWSTAHSAWALPSPYQLRHRWALGTGHDTLAVIYRGGVPAAILARREP